MHTCRCDKNLENLLEDKSTKVEAVDEVVNGSIQRLSLADNVMNNEIAAIASGKAVFDSRSYRDALLSKREIAPLTIKSDGKTTRSVVMALESVDEVVRMDPRAVRRRLVDYVNDVSNTALRLISLSLRRDSGQLGIRFLSANEAELAVQFLKKSDIFIQH